jgi:hypothetical protein
MSDGYERGEKVLDAAMTIAQQTERPVESMIGSLSNPQEHWNA